jgi:hypothetical protein
MSHGKICRIMYLTSLVMSMFGTINLIGCIFDKSIRLVRGFQICTKNAFNVIWASHKLANKFHFKI